MKVSQARVLEQMLQLHSPVFGSGLVGIVGVWLEVEVGGVGYEGAVAASGVELG